MILLVLAISLAAVLGRPEGEDAGEDPIWTELKSALPEEYVKHAEQTGLSTKRIFQNTLIHKLHAEVVYDTKTIEARQKILHEYVTCACKVCNDKDDRPGNSNSKDQQEPNRSRQFSLFNLPPLHLPNPLQAILHPQETITGFFQSCETELVLKTIKILRENLYDVQRRSNQISALVACNCVKVDQCRKLLDPLIYSIVTGQNDTELRQAYWQTQLKEFPQILERGIVDRLTSGIASIMTYFFQGSRPQKDPAPAAQPQAAPAPIFAPGVNPEDWHKRPKEDHCPSVQVNITNSKKGTEISVSNSTNKEGST